MDVSIFYLFITLNIIGILAGDDPLPDLNKTPPGSPTNFDHDLHFTQNPSTDHDSITPITSIKPFFTKLSKASEIARQSGFKYGSKEYKKIYKQVNYQEKMKDPFKRSEVRERENAYKRKILKEAHERRRRNQLTSTDLRTFERKKIHRKTHYSKHQERIRVETKLRMRAYRKRLKEQRATNLNDQEESNEIQPKAKKPKNLK